MVIAAKAVAFAKQISNVLSYPEKATKLSLDVAFSEEARDFLDPDKAYEFYWAGIITDKKKFVCPGTNCTAQVTCANLDKDTHSMRVAPHFKIYGNHSKNCEIFLRKPLTINYVNGANQKTELKPINESVVDEFLLERPLSYYDDPTKDPSCTLPPSSKSNYITQLKKTVLREYGSIGKIYSVRAVVSRYKRYLNDGSADKKRLNIKGKDYHYKNLFSRIWNQRLHKLSNSPKIYHGWAFINRLPSDLGYQIKFKKKFLNKESALTATIVIPDRLIQSYKIKKLVISRMSKINKMKQPTAYVFIYGAPKENSSISGITYANFNIQNLDLIDINFECPLEKQT